MTCDAPASFSMSAATSPVCAPCFVSVEQSCPAKRTFEPSSRSATVFKAVKTGAMTIQRLRKKAESELSDRFDVKEFHAQVLMTGSLPLAILEKKIDAWIAARKTG